MSSRVQEAETGDRRKVTVEVWGKGGGRGGKLIGRRNEDDSVVKHNGKMMEDGKARRI